MRRSQILYELRNAGVGDQSSTGFGLSGVGIEFNPAGGSKFRPQEWKTRRELLNQFETSLKKGREVLQRTTHDHLLNINWRMLAAGQLMSDQPRYVAIRDGVLNHMAYHRGQLTVYLRLHGEKVPAIYGPSADEGKG